MIVFTKDTQYNQCKREDILNFKNQNYINSLKHELKTGKGLINTALRYMPEMHLSLPNTVESEIYQMDHFKIQVNIPIAVLEQKLRNECLKAIKELINWIMHVKSMTIYYSKYKNTQARNVADDILASKASQIALNPNLPDYERKDARLVTGIMGVKSRFGMGIKKKPTNAEKLTNLYYDPKTGYSGIDSIARKSGIKRSEVVKWLTQQNVYSLHKPIRHRFKKRRVIVSKIDDQWQADLVDMQKNKSQNKNFNYILTVIDIFSKFAWAIPIKNKTGDSITRAFEIIFKDRIPTKLHTDKGLEFINKSTQNLFKRKGIHWFATENETKAQVVERFNRTLKSKMYKYFTAKGTKIWINIIDELVYNYNNSYHRSIKMTPVEGSLKKNSKIVYNNLFPKLQSKPAKSKFSMGDRVRISKKRKDFAKGYLPNFTEEVFIVVKVLKTEPQTYIIKDLNGEEIKGTFYNEELSRYDSELYEIEKVLKRKKDKFLVKWKGYEKPSWIDSKSIIETK